MDEIGRRRTKRRYSHKRQGINVDHPRYAGLLERLLHGALCEIPDCPRKSFCVDHDHATGVPRGILCDWHNRLEAAQARIEKDFVALNNYRRERS